jgi:hypothetical protein
MFGFGTNWKPIYYPFMLLGIIRYVFIQPYVLRFHFEDLRKSTIFKLFAVIFNICSAVMIIVLPLLGLIDAANRELLPFGRPVWYTCYLMIVVRALFFSRVHVDV